MLRLKGMKGLAVLMCICMIFGMLQSNVYADDGSIYMGAGGAAEVLYVGGPNAAAGNAGTYEEPYATLKEAADAIFNKSAGSYNIMMLGDTTESSTVEFSYPSGDPYDISITAAPTVTGSAITISRGSGSGSLIEVGYNATLTIEGSPETKLVFDGCDILADNALFNVFSGTLNVNAHTIIKNNNNTSGDGGSIKNNNVLNINGGVITGNTCSGRGGGIFNRGLMTMNDGTVSSNYCGWDGGGIYSERDFTIYNGLITNNTSDGQGSGIYNASYMTMEGGVISNNSNTCFANSGTVTMNDGCITDNEGAIAVWSNNTFNMTGGTIANNTSSYYTIHLNAGEFNFSGGNIVNNRADWNVAYVFDSSFNMTGGNISGNQAEYIFNLVNSSGDPDNGFFMSAGDIKDNNGISDDEGFFYGGFVIKTDTPITIGGDALISGVESVAEIRFDNYYNEPYINVSGPLDNIEKLTICLDRIGQGIKILAGSPLTENIVSKFRLDDNNYGINSSGYTEYIGGDKVYYVNKDGDNNASGTTSEEPLLTIEKAIEKIGTGSGTIILTSDIEVEDTIPIFFDITIKTDGTDRTIHGKISDSSYIFLVNDGKLTLGDTEQSTGELTIRNSSGLLLSSIIFAANNSELNLNHGLSIQGTDIAEAIIGADESVINIDGASITLDVNEDADFNIAIANYDGTVNFLSGAISAENENAEITGIFNTGTTYMSGGTINGFKGGFFSCGIYNEGVLKLSGGTISNNMFSIVNCREFYISQNPFIPIGDEGSNGIALSKSGGNYCYIYLNEDLELSNDNQMLIYVEGCKHGDIILLDDDNGVVEKYHSNFILSDPNFIISETGTAMYAGETPVYFVDATYEGMDSDGSEERPFTSLEDTVDLINNTLGIGIIKIRSDINIEQIYIHGDITILNDSSETYTISGDYYNMRELISISSEGRLTLGSMEGRDDEPNLIIKYGSPIINNYGDLNLYPGIKIQGTDYATSRGLIVNNSDFHMYGGVIADGPGYTNGGVYNEGTFIMSGGVIENCEGSNGGVFNEGDFIMEGGRIANCYGDDSGAVCNFGNFIMSGGVIEHNSSDYGAAIYNGGTMRLSADASIPMESGNSNMILLGSFSGIDIDSDLSDSNSFMITTERYLPGRKILNGDSTILANNYSKFVMDNEDYFIGPDGTLEYIGTYAEYYVDADNGNDSNTGSETSPFASLAKALEEIDMNGGVGAVHICSDIAIDDTMYIYGAVKLINEGTPHIISRDPYFDDIMFYVYGQLELSNSELNGQPEQALLTISGYKEGGSYESIIYNRGDLILNNGIVLEENEMISSYAGAIYNEGGIILMKGGVIQYNKAYNGAGIYNYEGQVDIFGGSIKYNETPVNDYYYGGGIYNYTGTVNISGGRIHNNKAAYGGGIYNDNGSTLTISGGSIYDNMALYGGALFNNESDTILSGGEIYGNTLIDNGIETPLASGIYINFNKFTIQGDVSISSDNDIVLEDQYSSYDGIYHRSYITVGGSLSEDMPTITLSKVLCNWDTYSYEMNYYPVGSTIIQPDTGYTLTANDISKFRMADSNYGISNLGKIAVSLKDEWFSLINADYLKYTGSEIRPGVAGLNGSTSLREGVDYMVSYANNINPGTATVYITGMGNYGGTVVKTFVILISENTYIITANAGANGTIKPSGEVSVKANGSQTFTIVPATGYKVASVLVNGVNMGAISSYTFTNVTANQTITATFELISSPTPPPSGGDTPTPTPPSSGGGLPAPAPTPVPTAVPTPTPTGSKIELDAKVSNSNGKVTINTEELIDKMLNDEITDVNVNIIQNSTEENGSIIIDPDLINAVKDTGTDIKFTVKNEDGKERYSWSFKGSEMAAMDREITNLDISLNLQKAADNKDLSELLELESPSEEKNKNSLVISFGHKGDLPAQASVRMYVGDMGYKEGDKLYLYYYNSETGKLDSLPYSSDYVVDSEGYITINIIHCSEYVLLPKKASAGAITSLRDQISVTPNKVTLTLGSKNKSKATIKVKLPKTLELVKDLKDKTSGSAIGAATVTYKSGNKKIATVDDSGKITAKKAGKVDIKVTVTLYSGKKKTFKVSVTVK